MAKAVNGVLGTDVEGLTTQAMQQGGIGLLLTVLIITVPPAAAMFFQGTLGSFQSFSAFNTSASGAAAMQRPQDQTLRGNGPGTSSENGATSQILPGLAHRGPSVATTSDTRRDS